MMPLLDSSLLEIVNRILSTQDRSNIGKQKFWYPLNHATYGAEEIVYALQSMLEFQTSMGRKVELVENMFAKFLETECSIFLNSGSSADLLAIRALVKSPYYNLKPGDKVLVPAITWPTQVYSIIQSGLVPVLYDVSPDTMNPDPSSIPVDVLSDVKAIFTTHILGMCGDLDILQEICATHDLLLIEDTCESLGASYSGKRLGTFGVAGTFSSFFSHHIMTIEGGFIATDSVELDTQIRLLRAHGWSRGIKPSSLNRYFKSRGLVADDYSSRFKISFP